MDCRVEIPKVIDCELTLPQSKSIMTRALIINALAKNAVDCCDVDCCDDTLVMSWALSSGGDYIDVGAAGTAMRFLTAYFACQEGRTVTIDGTSRMRQRPIGPLVEALRQMGANIAYSGEKGYPPLKINGQKLHGSALTMRGDVSSQFISAVLMISPLAGGITLTLEGETVSRPYIDMTLALMRHHGIEVHENGKSIVVAEGHYAPSPFYIEGDWSAASYWFALKALLPQSRITLSPLLRDSIQGDCAIVEMMAPLGVTCDFVDDSVILSTEDSIILSTEDSVILSTEDSVILSTEDSVILPPAPSILEGELSAPSFCKADKARLVPTLTQADKARLVPTLTQADKARLVPTLSQGVYVRDMVATPDLVPTLAVTLCLLRVPFRLTGVAALRLKESNRLEALREELAKLGYRIEVGDSTLCYDGNHHEIEGEVTLSSHDDHRIAMALSLAATRHKIVIKNAEVVSKSYPNWWDQLINAECRMRNAECGMQNAECRMLNAEC